MNPRLLSTLALGGLLACSQHVCAQVLPDLGNAVQNAVENTVERQVEQAQEAALERAAEQAQEAAENRALERAEAVQADTVQNQALDQVQNQVERAQAQAAEQAQAQLQRVQTQVENAQGQIGQVQSQAVERLQDLVPEVVPGVAAQVGVDEAVQDAAGTVAAAVPDGAAGDFISERLSITGADGTEAFVEITLAAGVRAVEFEWVMVVTPAERQRLNDEAPELLNYLTDTEPFALADDGELLTFRVPPDLDANDAILDLVPENMRDLIDRNHIYDTQDADSSAGGQGTTQDGAQLSLPMPAVCAEPVTLGMIDSEIDTTHPAFAANAAAIHQRTFVDAALTEPASHGTAIAGLLVGTDSSEQSGTPLHPLLPAATLYSAAVFHEQEAQQGATVMRVLAALDWMLAQEDVRVVNMSLAGPPNRLLARAVAAATAQGKVIVAAAGNDGPYGPMRYPAAYDEVIGVTAVARDTSIFRFANQGPHIDYAALGVDVPTALRDGGFGPESGTSLAAPVVAAFIACALAQQADVTQALAALETRALDLGAPGRDPVFGSGLLHP